MTTTPSHHRASLLSGLRTGGVRSISTNVPRTAAVTGAFEIPRFVSSMQHPSFVEEYEDDFGGISPHNMYTNYGAMRNGPMTAAVDSPRFSQQQQNAGRGMNPNSAPFQPSFNRNDPYLQSQADQNQALQMQLMQLEILRLQAIQNQQYQAELLAQQQAQKAYRRQTFNPPATASPFTTSFDQNPNVLRNPLNHVQLNGRYVEDMPIPPAPPATTVISGGTALGVSGAHIPTPVAPSKSDVATSWRRGGNNNSVLSGQNRPIVKVTPPPGEQNGSPSLLTDNSPLSTKSRPHPLNFNSTTESLATVVSDSTEEGDDGDSSTSKSSGSSPTTPHSITSHESSGLSPREEAAKKLYAGLGVGRPNPTPTVATTMRLVSQPMRQPRGPPSGIDELGPKNFASRIRRQAIGGLSALMGARERREVIEAY